MAQSNEDKGLEIAEDAMALRCNADDRFRDIARLTEDPRIISHVVAGRQELAKQKTTLINLRALFSKRKRDRDE